MAKATTNEDSIMRNYLPISLVTLYFAYRRATPDRHLDLVLNRARSIVTEKTITGVFLRADAGLPLDDLNIEYVGGAK